MHVACLTVRRLLLLFRLGLVLVGNMVVQTPLHLVLLTTVLAGLR